MIVNDVVLGHYIKEDDEPRVKIAQLSKVWVVGEVKEKDLGFISQLADAKISLAAFPDKELTGEIYHIDDVVDENTRSVKVMIEALYLLRFRKEGICVNMLKQEFL